MKFQKKASYSLSVLKNLGTRLGHRATTKLEIVTLITNIDVNASS